MRGLLLVFTIGTGLREQSADRWFGPDKLQHFFTSAFVQSAAYGALRRAGAEQGASLAGASMASAAVGVGKELRDRRAGRPFSVADLVWDAAGAGAASVLLVRTVR